MDFALALIGMVGFASPLEAQVRLGTSSEQVVLFRDGMYHSRAKRSVIFIDHRPAQAFMAQQGMHFRILQLARFHRVWAADADCQTGLGHRTAFLDRRSPTSGRTWRI